MAARRASTQPAASNPFENIVQSVTNEMRIFQQSMTNESSDVLSAMDETLNSLESMGKDLAVFQAGRLDNLNFSLRVLQFFNECVGVWAKTAENASPSKLAALETVAAGMRRTSIQEESEAIAAQLNEEDRIVTPRSKPQPTLAMPVVSLKEMKGIQLKTPKKPNPCTQDECACDDFVKGKFKPAQCATCYHNHKEPVA